MSLKDLKPITERGISCEYQKIMFLKIVLYSCEVSHWAIYGIYDFRKLELIIFSNNFGCGFQSLFVSDIKLCVYNQTLHVAVCCELLTTSCKVNVSTFHKQL